MPLLIDEVQAIVVFCIDVVARSGGANCEAVLKSQFSLLGAKRPVPSFKQARHLDLLLKVTQIDLNGVVGAVGGEADASGRFWLFLVIGNDYVEVIVLVDTGSNRGSCFET